MIEDLIGVCGDRIGKGRKDQKIKKKKYEINEVRVRNVSDLIE